MIFSDLKINSGRFTTKAAVFLSFFLFLIVGCNSENQESSDEKTEPKSTADDTLMLTNPCLTTSLSVISEITCPKCGFSKCEKMPEDVCLIKYACTKCKHEMVPDEGDCCVFCTYGTHKCPSMQ